MCTVISFGVSFEKQVRIIFLILLCFLYFIFFFRFNFPYLRTQLKEKKSFEHTFSFILFEKCVFNHLGFFNLLLRMVLLDEASLFYGGLEEIDSQTSFWCIFYPSPFR